MHLKLFSFFTTMMFVECWCPRMALQKKDVQPWLWNWDLWPNRNHSCSSIFYMIETNRLMWPFVVDGPRKIFMAFCGFVKTLIFATVVFEVDDKAKEALSAVLQLHQGNHVVVNWINLELRRNCGWRSFDEKSQRTPWIQFLQNRKV